jgi:DNA (cytosine-5)-methyltransferase 1
MAYSNGIASKVGGNDFANEAIGGKRDNNSSRSRSNDWGQFDAKKNEKLAYTDSQYAQGQQLSGHSQGWERPFMGQLALRGGASDRHGWKIEPDVGRVANGVAARVDRLKAIGNGQVPLCAATAWRILNA